MRYHFTTYHARTHKHTRSLHEQSVPLDSKQSECVAKQSNEVQFKGMATLVCTTHKLIATININQPKIVIEMNHIRRYIRVSMDRFVWPTRLTYIQFQLISM